MEAASGQVLRDSVSEQPKSAEVPRSKTLNDFSLCKVGQNKSKVDKVSGFMPECQVYS